MKETLSLYREREAPVIVFHNKNRLPHVNTPHLHSQYEFYYNIDGAGGMFADKKFYECTGRDLFLIPRLCVHKVLVAKKVYYERCIINVDSKVIEAINTMPHLHTPLAWLEGEGAAAPKKVNLTEQEHCEFLNLVERYHEDASNELLQNARLLELLAFLEQFFAVETGREEEYKKPISLPEQALLVVEEEFRDIKIGDISERLYVNSSHLSVVFKEEYGITLEQYLIVRKIAEAKKYLYMGVPVKEVCRLCGFHNDSNFSRTFKKYEGYSPKQLEELAKPL